MSEVLVGASLRRVPPAASTPVWAPLALISSTMRFYWGRVLRSPNRVSPQPQGRERGEEGT